MKIFNRYTFRPTDDRYCEPPCASKTLLIYPPKIRNQFNSLKTNHKEVSNLSVSRLNLLRTSPLVVTFQQVVHST